MRRVGSYLAMAVQLLTGIGLAQDPAVIGRFGPLISTEVIPIHVFLLPNGKLVYLDRHDMGTHHDRLTRLFDLSNNTSSKLPDPGYDLFCSGHSYLRDGTVLIAGGHIHGDIGEKGIRIFHPRTNTFDSNLPAMNAGRWYPTNTTLPNGDVVIIAGDIGPNNQNPVPDVYEARTRTLRRLTGANLKVQWYPWVYVVSATRVFMAGPEATTRYLDVDGAGKWTTVGNTNANSYRQYGTSVMYEPGRILIAGGGQNPPIASAEIIDLKAAAPKWTYTESMKFARRNSNSTILPDGRVLVTGGTAGSGFNNSIGSVYDAEVWDPALGKWTTWAKAKVMRNYHSIALLLPDGRVLTGGGGNPGDEAVNEPPHKDFEIFEPPYLFKGARPVIDAVPDTLRFGREFTLQTRATGNLQVTLLKMALVTHSFNQNQNFNRLAATAVAGGLRVKAPSDSIVTQPGPHLLFLLDAAGVPSVGKVVFVDSGEDAVAVRPLPGVRRVAGTGGQTVRADGRRRIGAGSTRQVRIPAP